MHYRGNAANPRCKGWHWAKLMLIEMVEFEGFDRIKAAVSPHLSGADTDCHSLFDNMEFLFWGRAETAPGLWIAGGLTKSGHSVTGSAPSTAEALLGLIGELAETQTGATRSAYRDPDKIHGFAAHRQRPLAIRHARDELIERHVVGDWWQGHGAARIWHGRETDRILQDRGQGRRENRPYLTLVLADRPDRSVIVTASFNPAGREFCFGAACRAAQDTAFLASARELAQAEFGLRLAQTKRQVLGDARLSSADRLTLDMAEQVDRDRLLSHLAGSEPVADDGPDPIPTAIAEFDVAALGGWLHVVGAVAAAPTHRPPSKANPFSHINLY